MNDEIIEIKEGHDPSSYFWIMPVKVRDMTKDANDIDNVDEYRKLEISIEEENIRAFLFPLLLKYFDDELPENLQRYDNHVVTYTNGIQTTFEWYLTYNYYTMQSIQEMINEIKSIIELLKDDYNSTKLDYIKEDYDWILYLDHRVNTKNLPYDKNERIKLTENYKDVIINFYNRFIKYMENMIKEGKEKGYTLISLMGP